MLLERTKHIGGLPANGLGATDIGTRDATGGLFREFVQRNKQHYIDTYGANSQQVKDCSDGFHFEPSVGEKVLEKMLAEQPKVTVLRQRQFDAKAENVKKAGERITSILITNLAAGAAEEYEGKVFLDATYEGDLAAAAGVPFRTRREGKDEYNEPCAGRVYKKWGGPVDPASTGEGDDTIQAFNYRLCLTTVADNLVPFPKPATYNREEYISLIEDVKLGRHTGASGAAPKGIAWLTNQVKLPNGKTDSNNQHLAFISTDLPEENYPWPTADWAWRDKFAQRLREYTLGLFWFAANDPALPEDFRKLINQWGLAKDEYQDNENFPRQVYVREGRRIEGMHLFTAHDALPTPKTGRPPIYENSITASHYALDSHAHHKREPGKVHLDGFFSWGTKPYTVPYGVMVPKKVENLICPVPVSGTHVGFSTLRMEPCWMAMGEAAGIASAIAIADGVPVQQVNTVKMQRGLLKNGAVLMWYSDVKGTHPAFEALQFFGVRGFIPGFAASLNKPAAEGDAKKWSGWCGIPVPKEFEAGKTTRGQLLQMLYGAVQAMPIEAAMKVRAGE